MSILAVDAFTGDGQNKELGSSIVSSGWGVASVSEDISIPEVSFPASSPLRSA